MTTRRKPRGTKKTDIRSIVYGLPPRPGTRRPAPYGVRA